MISVPIQLVLVALLVLYLVIARRERARRAEENLPGGFAGFREDFKRHLPDRLFLLFFLVSWIAFTFGPAIYQWYSSAPADPFTLHQLWAKWFAVVLVISLWFFWRRRELERLQTYQASGIALLVVLVELLRLSYRGSFAAVDADGLFRLVIVAFFGSYLILRRLASAQR
jgi:hypothetical protein